jgi:hypothetical protein
VGHLKIFHEPQSQKSSDLHKSSLKYCKFKFVQIMDPRRWVGPQWGKAFLHVFIVEKNLFPRTDSPILIKQIILSNGNLKGKATIAT